MREALGPGGLAYGRVGSGPLVVLLHGTPASRVAWEPLIPFLAPRRELLMVDLPGFGASPPLTAAPTPQRFAKVLTELIDGLSLAKPHVAGHSMGGWVGLELAKLGAAKSVPALAPAGLWRRRSPRATNIQLRIGRTMARRCRLIAPRVLASPTGRASKLVFRPARLRCIPTHLPVTSGDFLTR